MSLYKKAKVDITNKSLEPLNVPQWEEYNLVKLAHKVSSVEKNNNYDVGGFDIKKAVKENPEFLFLKIFAIKEDEVNDNGDSFPKEELKKSAHTFVGVPIFCNHQNDDIEKARGKVVHSWYEEKAGGIFIIAKIDRVAYPALARGVEENYINGCFPPDAPVLMSNGTEKCISDVDCGEFVISGKGNIRRVLGKRQKGYNHPLINLSVEGLNSDIKLTEYHNIYVYRTSEKCLCGCNEDIFDVKDKRITKQTFTRKFLTGHNMKGTELPYENIQKIKAKDVKIGDLLIEPKYTKEKEKNYISEDEAFLIGLFLAEGSFEKREGIRHSVIFNFGSSELETLASKCFDLLGKVFSNKENSPTINHYPDSSQTRVCLYGKDVAAWFLDKCGEYSYDKVLNEKLLNIDKNLTAALLAGYIEGDGYNVKKKIYGVATVSEKLASQLRILFSKIGIRTRYRVVKNTGKWGYRPVHEIVFGLTTSKKLREKLIYKKAKENEYKPAAWHNLEDIVLRKVTGIQKTEYNGEVYDLEIEEDHSYCVNHIMVSNTSMGCSVDVSVCNICGSAAKTAEEYCDHIKHRKNKTFTGKVELAYGKNGIKVPGYDSCPVKFSNLDEDGKIIHKESKTYEHNFGIKFIEDSLVVNPACHDCLVHEVFNTEGLSKKVAKLGETLSNCHNGACSISDNKKVAQVQDKINKISGALEIKFLNDAMDKIERVAKSMMAQKEHISMEYVSDLVEVIAKIQEYADELIENGYTQLPSIVSEDNAPIVNAVAPIKPQPVPQMSKEPENNSNLNLDMGSLGNVTMPKAASLINNEKEKKEFINLFINLKEMLKVFSNRVENIYKVSQLKNIEKESDVMSTKNSQNDSQEKVASHDTNVVTERQLDNAKFTGERTNDSPTVVTEKQLDNPKDVNVTSTDSPQERRGSYDVITEKQLDSIKNGYVVRWNEYPDVITEKQWNETSRLVGSILDKDQSTITTEKQLDDFRSHHSFPIHAVITEKQLDAAKGDIVNRWADSKEIVKTAKNILAETIVNFGKTPSEIINAVEYINKNVKNLDKASFLTLVNALPNKKENRFAETNRYGYFSKVASGVNTPNAIDSLILTVSENLQGFSTDNLFEAMKVVTSSEEGMKMVEASVQNALKQKENVVTTVNKKSDFESALKSLAASEAPSDGIYQIASDLSEIGVPLENKREFLKSVAKFARSEINNKNIKVALTAVDVDEENGLVVATMKDVNVLSADEKIALAQINPGWMKPGADGFDDLPDASEVYPGEEQTAVKDGLPTDADMNNIPNDGFEDVSLAGTVSPGSSNMSAEQQLEQIFNGGVAGNGPSKKSIDAPEQTGIEPDGFGEDNKMMMAASTKRKAMVKQAQMFGGQGGAGVGGEIPGGPSGGAGAGAGATLPQPPTGGQPPLESFEQSDMGQGLEEGGMDELNAVPPGTKCPVCSSDDVDVVSGKGQCNNCGSKWWYESVVHITNDASRPDHESEEAGEGFALPEDDGAAKGMEAAASYKIVALEKFSATTLLTKTAREKISKNNIKLGSVSPLTGSTNTIEVSANEHLCLDTGIPYSVKFASVSDKPNEVYATWIWNPLTKVSCDSCSREKQNIVKALEKMNITEEQFDFMDIATKGKTILAMKDKGLLGSIKTAGKKASAIETYKNTFSKVASKDFPCEMCRQKLANRFGENAVCLSGPYEGKPLADAICNSLRDNGVYSTKLAMSVGEDWMEKDAQSECLQDYLKIGYNLRQSQTICTYIKTKYAQIENQISEELGSGIDENPEGPGGPGGLPTSTPEVTTDMPEEISPFNDEGQPGTVSVELPLDLLEKLDAAIDIAKGENPAEEEHHNIEVPEVEVEVEMPGNVADTVDTVVDKVLDENLGTESNGVPAAPVEEKPLMENIVSPLVAPAAIAAPAVSEVAPAGGEVVEIEVTEEPSEVVEESTESTDDESDDDESDDDESDEDESDEDNKDENSEEEKEGEEEKEENNDEDENDNPGVTNKDTSKKKVEKEGEEGNMITEKEASTMRPGYIPRQGSINGLNLSGVLDVINKQKKVAKGLEQENVQDSKDIGKIKDGKTIGIEQPLNEKGPKIPSKGDGSKIGDEQPVKTKEVDVPSADARIGGEKDNDKATGGDTRFTGGEEGAGNFSEKSKSASTKNRMNRLADSIIQASEKKVEVKAPQDDADVKPYSNGKTIGEEEKFSPETIKDKDVKSDGGFIGKEKETLKDKPKDAPSIPAGGGKLKTDTSDAEKQNEVKGTTIAESEEVKLVTAKATTIAGRMLEAGKITVKDLGRKIDEFKALKLAQLSSLEQDIFPVKKGLDVASDGLEQTVVIGNKETKTASADVNLTKQLTEMFTLGKRNELASETEHEFKKTYGRN